MVTHAPLTNSDRARIAAAITAAEALTSVEFRLVHAHWSSHYGAFALIYSGLVALIAGGAAAAVSPDLPSAWLFIGQAVIFGVAVLALQWPALRRALAPPHVKRKAAWRHARLHYASIGLTQPHTRNAALVFCSEAERYVEILVDDAIAEKLPPSVWTPIADRFKADLAGGHVGDAFVTAAGACAAILAPVFPPIPGQVSEIPDALVEL
jgi:putative membrane protein